MTPGSRDSDIEICCSSKQSRLEKEPFAHTGEEAKTKPLSWQEEWDLGRCDQHTDTAGGFAVEKMALKQRKYVGIDSSARKGPSNSLSVTTEAEAVRYLR
jgi:hypothetical protein